MSVLRFDPFGDPFRGLDRLTNQLVSGTRTPMGMPMDVWQTEDGYHVALDLPGVQPDTVEITTERNVLTIQAHRQPEFPPGANVVLAERPQGGFTRQLQLGDTVDVERVQASYDNGVLHLTVPLSRAAQPRRIEVQSGSTGQQQLSVATEQAGSGETPGSPGGQGAGSVSGS